MKTNERVCCERRSDSIIRRIQQRCEKLKCSDHFITADMLVSTVYRKIVLFYSYKLIPSAIIVCFTSSKARKVCFPNPCVQGSGLRMTIQHFVDRWSLPPIKRSYHSELSNMGIRLNTSQPVLLYSPRMIA